MKRSILYLFVFLFPCLLAAQGLRFHGTVRNSVYALEEQQAVNRFYQYARLNLTSSNRHFAVHSSLRAHQSSVGNLANADRFKLYSFHVDGRDLLNRKLDFSIGRMFLHPGTTLGGLDGAQVNYDFSKHYSVLLYAGAESNNLRSFDIGANEHMVSGGTVEIKNYMKSKVQFLYLRKADDREVFWNITGLNVSTAPLANTMLKVQAHYDLENERMHRSLVSLRNTWSDKLMTSLQFKAQHPQVYANSYYTIFTPQAYQRYRIAAAYEFLPGYHLEGLYQHVDFEDESADQIYLTVGSSFGSCGVVMEQGYSGQQIGVMLDLYYEIMKNLMASVYVDYSKYRVEQIYEYDNQIANAARLSYRLKNWTFDVEYQWLTNRYKQSDHRLLNHISFVW